MSGTISRVPFPSRWTLAASLVVRSTSPVPKIPWPLSYFQAGRADAAARGACEVVRPRRRPRRSRISRQGRRCGGRAGLRAGRAARASHQAEGEQDSSSRCYRQQRREWRLPAPGHAAPQAQVPGTWRVAGWARSIGSRGARPLSRYTPNEADHERPSQVSPPAAPGTRLSGTRRQTTRVKQIANDTPSHLRYLGTPAFRPAMCGAAGSPADQPADLFQPERHRFRRRHGRRRPVRCQSWFPGPCGIELSPGSSCSWHGVPGLSSAAAETYL